MGTITGAVLYDETKHEWAPAGSTVSGASAPVLMADGCVFLAAVQVGAVKGHLVPLVVGGQVFEPQSGDWTFATSTSLLATFRVGLDQLSPVVGASGRTAVVLLDTGDVALSFDPERADRHLD